MEPCTSKTVNYESDSSNDSTAERCPICLLSLVHDQEIGKPSVCDHTFCFPCIQEWSRVMQTCPIDRKEYNEINVFAGSDQECAKILRTVQVSKEKINLDEYIENDSEVTSCEICSQINREDSMLLCDGCDKGFHMDCLNPPLLEIPHGNWYCDDCFESSSEESEEENLLEQLEELNNELEDEIGELPNSRLRNRARAQSPMLRTRESERIRTAILSRTSLRGALAALGESRPSTSGACFNPKPAVRRPRKRRTKKRRRRARTTVVEYDVDGSDKFAMKTRRVARRIRKKRRKVVKSQPRKSSVNNAGGGSFKSSNPNVHDLQKSRAVAGLSNFNIFEPTNNLDYVSDDNVQDSGIDYNSENSAGTSTLAAAVISFTNPSLRRSMMIKNRVLSNFTQTSTTGDLLDSILQDQDKFTSKNISSTFSVDKSSGKIVFVGKIAEKVKKAAGVNEAGSSSKTPSPPASTSNPSNNSSSTTASTAGGSGNLGSANGSDDKDNNDEEKSGRSGEKSKISSIFDDPDDDEVEKEKKKKKEHEKEEKVGEEEEQCCPNDSIYSSHIGSSAKKQQKKEFDMFDENSEPDPVKLKTPPSQMSNEDVCPNLSIYSHAQPLEGLRELEASNSNSNSFFQSLRTGYDEEEMDLVQQSDGENPQGSTESINKSNAEKIEDNLPIIDDELEDEREKDPEKSYTPPPPTAAHDDDNDEKKRKEKSDQRRNKKRELERYNVRNRIREPVKSRDKFGRNRSRTRSRSTSRKRRSRNRSNSSDPRKDRKNRRKSREKSREYRDKKDLVKQRKSRSMSRSRSPRRRTPSPQSDFEKRRKMANQKVPPKEKQKNKTSNQRSRSRSITPRLKKRQRTPSPAGDRRARSKSKNKSKPKRKKREHSKEKHHHQQPNLLTKEIFTSGQNILVSVNFNNKLDKTSGITDDPKEIVDITKSKKINILSKPVAIIDLARSPFKELTPEYNVIELSDSDGENQLKSPDSNRSSSKLYDPFDILNSPSNDVTSSENASRNNQHNHHQESSTSSSAVKPPAKELVQEIMKNVANFAFNTKNLTLSSNLMFNEEHLVSSSSAPADKLLQMNKIEVPSKVVAKDERIPMIESPYSPGNEYDDMYEPADEDYNAKSPKASGARKKEKQKSTGNIFDDIFGGDSPPMGDKMKSSRKIGGDKGEKFLNKLKRQERVVEEVKLVIKPYYSKKTINKDQYKEILRKAVPKICHSKEINPKKIKGLIDAYVKKFRHQNRKDIHEEIL
ncbi:unnamed protein product [Diamesa serratosioi]